MNLHHLARQTNHLLLLIDINKPWENVVWKFVIKSTQNTNHYTHLSHHATLTPPPSPPTSDDTQNSEQKTNSNGQQFTGNETSVLIKEPRRPPRACDSTDTMLASHHEGVEKGLRNSNWCT